MAQKRQFSLEASKMLKRKSSEIFRTLPKVPTTQYLEPAELTRDILYSGYRPVGYPVRENPLFKEAGWKQHPKRLRNDSSEMERSARGNIEHNAMAGPHGNGGIGSGGVNGTWRYNPRIPSKLLPFNLWSSSSMAMEYHSEWIAVPRTVVNKLRPFDVPPIPVAPEIQTGIANGSTIATTKSSAPSPNTLQLQPRLSPARKRSKSTDRITADKKLSKQVDQFISYLREKDRG
ncbi:LANO_0H21330g1_1 [Lachancea nothofagi CBS 11611]|uniref:LANO_0H21330g1_1 n=1 Tax=Lachancea nothofagi CBS 11611 TaxID=1266666 RepID=A0A1G4KND2_9SACH|nr:LANO_0H21330g1_1 [Lachancea nothofagi CBS 11611]